MGLTLAEPLQLEKEKSPHWRNPHLCLFWIGPRRNQPIIKMRSGAIIQRVGMADVPTGYLGPEKEDELDSIDEKTPREALSKSRRFDIMKRDGFRCQLCGATQGKEQCCMLTTECRWPKAVQTKTTTSGLCAISAISENPTSPCHKPEPQSVLAQHGPISH